MKPRRVLAPLVLGGLLVGLPATPAFAADSPAPAAVPADTALSTTLPVFGVGISLDVTLDAAGHLTMVEVVGDTTDIVATSVSAHKVSLVNTTTGAEVQIQTSTHKIQTKMESSDLADLLGPGTWTGDLFGDGVPVTVTYVISDDGSGTPVISDIGVSGGLSFTLKEETEVEGDEIEVQVKIAITGPDGAEAEVKIKVEVEEEDGRTETELKISARSRFMFEGEHGDDPTLNVPVDEDYDDDHEDHHDDDDDDDHHDDDDDDDEDDDDDHRQGKGHDEHDDDD